MSLKDDLIAAKALIDTPEKWGKGIASFERSYSAAPDGPVCAAGACNSLAFSSSVDGAGSYIDMVSALHAALPGGASAVADYNDRKSTTHADIMALFDRAIAAAGAA